MAGFVLLAVDVAVETDLGGHGEALADLKFNREMGVGFGGVVDAVVFGDDYLAVLLESFHEALDELVG